MGRRTGSLPASCRLIFGRGRNIRRQSDSCHRCHILATGKEKGSRFLVLPFPPQQPVPATLPPLRPPCNDAPNDPNKTPPIAWYLAAGSAKVSCHLSFQSSSIQKNLCSRALESYVLFPTIENRVFILFRNICNKRIDIFIYVFTIVNTINFWSLIYILNIYCETV